MSQKALDRETPEYQGNLLFTRIRKEGAVEVARATRQVTLFQMGDGPESLAGLKRLLRGTEDQVIVHNFRRPRPSGDVLDHAPYLERLKSELRTFDVISTGADMMSLASERNTALAGFYDTLLVMRSFAQQTGSIPHRILLDPVASDFLDLSPANIIDFARASVAPHDLPRLVVTDTKTT